MNKMATAGFYIAHHPWLDSPASTGLTSVGVSSGQLYKVGHTGDLGARLLDSAYTTCFPAGWRFMATFECSNKEAAFLLETAVLHCCRGRRVDGRELVKATLAELTELAVNAADVLGIRTIRRDMPEYKASVRTTQAAAQAAASAPSTWAKSKILVESLTLAEPPSIDDYIDDILSWDFTMIGGGTDAATAAATVAAVPTTAATPPTVAAPTVAVSTGAALAAEVDDIDDDVLEFAGSPFDYTVGAPLELRDYQREAIAGVTAELRATGKAILQMACRCGKTPVAYAVLRDFLAADPTADERPVCAVYLVPGLSLLRQTAQKLIGYGFTDAVLLVGSDPRPVPVGSTPARTLTMTTDPAVIRAFLAERGRRLVLSTYQSSPLIPTAAAFALTVFDEAHRVCGGRTPRPFNSFVLAPRTGARLFMTATPAYDANGITMKDRELFGGVAYRYHLRRGIAAGFVNSFRLEIVAANSRQPSSAGGDPDQRQSAEAALPSQIMSAMSQVDKLLVFCRDIRHATNLAAAVAALPCPAGVAPFEVLAAHSRMAAGGAASALRQFAEPGKRKVLFNCRLFQEGVEIPALNAVFFAAPRHSPRDIIQSVCRPLNAAAGKPPSVIFLPVLSDPSLPAADPANLRRFASIVPFVDALLDEDPGLYEHLLDPVASPYPISALGTHSLALTDPAARAALLGAVRRAVRFGAAPGGRPVERLLRAAAVPWDRAYAEIRRVVLECGRYPKTTDMYVVGEARCSLHAIHKYYVSRWEKGELEPFQAAALAALPGWEPYGVEGPYPWKLCMAFLEQWLEEHGGTPPMCEINKGGYVGLDASAMERLSGALTIVNQSDGKKRANGGSGYTLPAEKQTDLARICGKWNLRWKKERDANGELIEGGPKTFIQESHARFNAYYRAHKDIGGGEYIQTWFKDYPMKHSRQENELVRANKALAPPRKKLARQAAAVPKVASNTRPSAKSSSKTNAAL